VTSGDWLIITRGIYLLSGAPRTWEQRLQAAILDHPGSLAAGRSAGSLHGFEGFRQSRPEILVPFEGNARSSLARVIRSRHFDVVEAEEVRGYPTTSVAETILTLSLREHPPTIERIIDNQLARGKVTIPDFHPIIDRLQFARQPGLGALRRIVAARADDAYQPPTTELEHLLYRVLDRPEVPGYTRQLPIAYPQMDATVDAYIGVWRMITEADGRRWHTRKADFERDRERDNAAAAAGIVVVRFTYKMLRYKPEECLKTLLQAGQWRQPA
jgi:very-short-patch-repair endonuclease